MTTGMKSDNYATTLRHSKTFTSLKDEFIARTVDPTYSLLIRIINCLPIKLYNGLHKMKKKNTV